MFSWVTLKHLVEWTQGSCAQGLDLPVRKISTDTRKIEKGDIFLALKGENFDGHAYIDTAVKNGASAVVAESIATEDVPTVCVKDTLAALVAIGRNLRSHFKGPVVAISGSAGKSSTKEMVATLLGDTCVKSPASYNNLIGVSQTCFLLEDKTEFLVLEMGMNALGELTELTENFQPHYGMLTNIGDAHVGKVGGPEKLYQAKKELFEGVQKSGAKGYALNLDDARVTKAAEESFSKDTPSLSYSLTDSSADVSVSGVRMNPDNAKLDLTLKEGGESFEIQLPIFGLHHAQNIAASFAMGRLVGVDQSVLVERLSNIQPADHRGEIFDLPGDRTLIDESYNSSPAALRSAIESLSNLNPKRRRFVVVGDMRELEEYSAELHRKAGEHIAEKLAGQPTIVLGVGEEVQALVDAVGEMPSHRVANAAEALTWIRQKSEPGDIIFVKSSRGGQLDKIVAGLQENIDEK